MKVPAVFIFASLLIFEALADIAYAIVQQYHAPLEHYDIGFWPVVFFYGPVLAIGVPLVLRGRAARKTRSAIAALLQATSVRTRKTFEPATQFLFIQRGRPTMIFKQSFTPFIVLILAAAGAATPARSQGIDFDKAQFSTEKLAPNFYTLTGSPGVDPGHMEGAGGRIGFLVGPDGVLMVDASYLPLAPKALAAIRKISPGPVRILISTHEHPDHTGGIPYFAGLGALTISREEVRRDLAQMPPPPVVAAIGAAASFTDPRRLPVLTYGLGSPLQLHFDGEIVDIIPVRPAHTDGDTIVRFESSDVIMIGDFYRNYGYPFIDPTHGGTFKGVISALDQVAQLSGPNTKLVPGHGSPITRADLAAYRAMILDVQEKVQQMIAQGKSLPEVLAAKLTAPYDARVPGGLTPLPAGLGTSADRFVGSLYSELKGNKQ